MEQIIQTSLFLLIGIGLGFIICFVFFGNYILDMIHKEYKVRKRNKKLKYKKQFNNRMEQIEKHFYN